MTLFNMPCWAEMHRSSSPLRLGSFDERCQVGQRLGTFEKGMLFFGGSAFVSDLAGHATYCQEFVRVRPFLDIYFQTSVQEIAEYGRQRLRVLNLRRSVRCDEI
jgi:hypothetical protein